MKRKYLFIICTAVLCFLVFTSVAAHARKVKGVNIPESATIEGRSCKLNGAGIRKKIIINVYIGALYLEKSTKNETAVISSNQIKRVAMHFLYKEVTAEQLIDAWNEGFEKNNTGDAVSSLKDKINRFNGFFTEPMKKGGTMGFTYIPGKGTEVKIKRRVRGTIEGADFMKALFAIWFGPYPPSKGLKKGMLGE